MNKAILFALLLCAGCSSPVLKLRAIGENQEDRQVAYVTSNLLDRANNAAFWGKRGIYANAICKLSSQKVAQD